MFLLQIGQKSKKTVAVSNSFVHYTTVKHRKKEGRIKIVQKMKNEGENAAFPSNNGKVDLFISFNLFHIINISNVDNRLFLT